MNVVLLCFFWISWCVIHSILIDVSVVGFIKKHAIGLTRYYRLLYNAFSLATFIPLIIFTKMAEGQVVVSWEGYAIPIRALLLVVSFLLFKGGAQQYDLKSFLGLKQLQTGKGQLLMSETESFTENGIFAITRHPWYLGSLLFIWTMLPNYPLPVFLAVCIMSIYLVVGTMLEERKIVAQYGDSYRRYQQRVSMFFPWKWLVRLLR
jgi:methanethiol S-methyltransferase